MLVLILSLPLGDAVDGDDVEGSSEALVLVGGAGDGALAVALAVGVELAVGVGLVGEGVGRPDLALVVAEVG